MAGLICWKLRVNIEASRHQISFSVRFPLSSSICLTSNFTAGCSTQSSATGIAIMQIGLSYLWMLSLQNICKTDIFWEEIKLQNIPNPGITACK